MYELSALFCGVACDVCFLHCCVLLSPAPSYSDRIFSLSSRANYKDLHEKTKIENLQRVEKSLLSVKVFPSYCSYRVNEARAFPRQPVLKEEKKTHLNF